MHKTGAHRMTAASSAAAFVTEAPDKSWIIKQTCLSGTAMPSPITSVGKRGGTGAMRWCPAGICPGGPRAARESSNINERLMLLS
jgi:hypothetical protein